MVDPITGIVLPIAINLVTGRADAKMLAPGLDSYVDRWNQRKRPLNHNLEKELRRSLLLALNQLAVECQKSLKTTATYFQGAPSNQAAKDSEWLKRKSAELTTAIANVDATVDAERKNEKTSTSMLSYQGEVWALLRGQGVEEEDSAIQAFRQKYLTAAMSDWEGMPERYREAIAHQLPSLLHDNFVGCLKKNSDAMAAFIIESQTQLQLGQETMQDWLQQIIQLIARDKPQLSLDEWRAIAQLRMAAQQALSTNPITQRKDIEHNRVDVYVPLGLVERRQAKASKSSPQESSQDPARSDQASEREQETITPITEDEFFQKLLHPAPNSRSQGRRIAIIGEPGSGKTTRLQAIADWILANNHGIPIWIPLADFTEPTLSQHLKEIWLEKAGVEGAIESFKEHKEHLWLLMDGLDEMVARPEGRQFSQLLDGWIASARVMITCRVNVWDADKNAFSGFDVYRNLPFEVDQVEEFIRRFFA